MAGSASVQYTPRVSQIDSLVLDAEFRSLVKLQLMKIFDKLKVAHWCEIYGPEFEFIFASILWKLTLGTRGFTVGQRLLGLKYENTAKKLKLFYIIQILGRYLCQRLSVYLPRYVQFADVSKVLKRIEGILSLAEGINFCCFLIQNKYPSLIHRICRLRMIPAVQREPYAPGDSYQIRELLWHQFSDFLMITLPFFKLYIVKKYWLYLKQYWSVNRAGQVPSTVTTIVPVSTTESTAVLKCCFCQQDAVVPHRLGNCHLCYYCLKSNTFDETAFLCSIASHNTHQ